MLETSSPDMLRQIAELARARRLDEAALLAATAIQAAPHDPVLAALAGAVEFHRGQFARAIPYLEVAHNHRPDDLTVRSNLADALFRCDQPARARALCDPQSAAADASSRLARLGAHLAQQADDYAQAVALYRLIVQRDPKDWASWNNLGNALGPTGDFDGAAEALQRAAALAPDAQPIRANLGNALIDAGRYAEAEAVLRQAAADFPTDVTPLLALFTLLKESGREDEAYETITAAAQRAPDRAEVQSDLGQEAARRNEYDIAENSFETALRLKPDLGPAFVGLASVYERMNREAELEPLRDRALAGQTDAESLAYIDALRFKRGNDFPAALAALEQSGEVVVPGRKLHLRGVMLDRLGQHDEAMAAFIAMNDHWKQDPTRPVERAREYRDAVAQATSLMTPAWRDSWQAAPFEAERQSPIFLVGFPRSGTTLLDTMLMADPRVTVLEEEPFLTQAEFELGGIETFPTLSAEAITEARATYFQRVEALTGAASTAIIVDKHPLHLNKVAVIRRLFPDARFVLALRHPCDVLLSCFLTNFRINNAMSNFLDLEDAATLYDQTFTHWETARAVFDVPVATVVYERLVEDTARELRPVFDWLGLEWPAGELDHRAAARARGTVSTASYSQVTEPIYKRAAGRWQRYAGHLAPVLDRLQPWVARYGYSLEDGRIPVWPEQSAE